MKFSLHYALAAALSLVLSLPLAVRADEHEGDKPKEDKQAQAEKSEKDKDDKDKVKGMKTFTLEHRSPQEIRQLVMLCEGMHGPQAGQPRTTTGFRGTAQPGQPGQPGQPAQPKISVAIDEEKKLVMVRGEEKHLEQVEKLISKLDVSDDDLEKIELEKVTLIPLKKESAQRANAALSQLQLRNHQMVSMGDVTLIAILTGEDDDDEQKKKSEQAKEVISKFEKEDKEKDDEDKENDED